MTKRRIFFWGSAIVAALWVASLFNRSKLPDLTHETLKKAQLTWEKNVPSHYRFQIDIKGVQQNSHLIEVQNGKVTRMLTNGQLSEKRVWPFWHMEALFGFLEEELVSREQPQATFSVSEPNKVYLSASFDSQLGFPTRYLRQVFGRKKTIEWTIHSFEALL